MFYTERTEMEQWKDIEGFEGYYQVSDMGRVRSLDRVVTTTRYGKPLSMTVKGKVLRAPVTRDGYVSIQIFKASKYYTFKVHRLVANAFIDNPDNLPEINHIDGNKQNNAASNLEWCTRGHNISHAFRTGLIDPKNRRNNRKAVRRSDGVVFESLTKAAEESGTHVSGVSMCCHGRLAHTAGYGFEFV